MRLEDAERVFDAVPAGVAEVREVARLEPADPFGEGGRVVIEALVGGVARVGGALDLADPALEAEDLSRAVEDRRGIRYLR